MRELPEGWKQATVGDVATVQLGRQRSPKNHVGEHMRPYLRSANVTWQGIDVSDVKEMNFEPSEASTFQLNDGDILLNEASGSPGEVGKPAIWRNEVPGACFQNTLLRVRSAEMDTGYLYWHFFYAARSGRFGEAGRGVNIRHLGKQGLTGYPVPVPPLLEQRRIVAAIEKHFSHLNAAETEIERISKRIAGFGRQMLSEILEVAAAPSIDDDTPTERLPAKWVWRRAGDVCGAVVSGSTPKPSEMTKGSGEVPFIKVYNVGFDGKLDFTNKPTFVSTDTHRSKLKRSLVVPGDVLTNIVGPPLGKMSVVPDTYPEWNINQAIAAFKPSDEIEGSFLSQLLLADVIMRPLLRTGKATAGQVNLSISSCRRLWLPVPPMHEQRRLVPEIDAALSVCERLEGECRKTLARTGSLRRSILAAAFSGRLVPQDPSDEPASALLERIAAERAAVSPSRKKKAITS